MVGFGEGRQRLSNCFLLPVESADSGRVPYISGPLRYILAQPLTRIHPSVRLSNVHGRSLLFRLPVRERQLRHEDKVGQVGLLVIVLGILPCEGHAD